VNAAVYYDPEYPQRWLSSEASKAIVRGLSYLGMQQLDAESLRAWMRQNGGGSLVVLGQDVAPDSVFEHDMPTTTLRAYLDRGGTVVWMGDTPLWSQGHRGRQVNELWQSLPFVQNLGIIPIFAVSVDPVRLTAAGKRVGLSQSWVGLRPVSFVSKSLRWTALAKGQAVVSRSTLTHVSWLGRLSARLRGVTVGAGHLSVGVSLAEGEDPGTALQWSQNGLIHGWIRRFAHGGRFVRIWDHMVPEIDDTRLADLDALCRHLVSTSTS
jgi:hypothetical protein